MNTIETRAALASKSQEIKKTKWWKWDWDKMNAKFTAIGEEGSNISICDEITRWRRGWITLYRTVTTKSNGEITTRWTLFFPFNISLGISLENE